MTETKPWGKAQFAIVGDDGGENIITVQGRDRWALECLVAAGAKGVSPIDHPGPRWSAYTFNLRALGVRIETVTEPHAGPFAGHHARYVLRSRVSPVGMVAA
ncbi:MAG: hypothetical protein IOC80_04280 [Rhodobacter sp.]|nr:hypothetical protein [Rhodobacter sp.]MCA3523571.1 hypothetical protein [Rhodobacter sp.]MCA3526420.1 hypothetical protein [Rhodobacter sp.]MCA3529630.1 hypothetical protein [Rhodobacter sp.]MCA3531510.1 hypothetical protein [Rhodobacter sp.]